MNEWLQYLHFGGYVVCMCIYECLFSCRVDVIHSEYGNILILLYGLVEPFLNLVTFYISYSNYFIVM